MENAKTSDYITYPRTFEKYRWYKPIITAIIAAVIFLALCYISAQVIIIAVGRQTITTMLTSNLSGTSIASLLLFYFMALILPSLYIANRIVRDRPFSSYCSSRGGWNWMIFFKCAAITLAAYLIITLIEMVLINSFDIENHMALAFIIGALIFVSLQCMAEEFLFRGFLMQTRGSWFNINGKTTTVKTGSDGIAKIKITEVPGKYTIKTTYKGKTVKNTVTVKQVLTASKVTVKKTAKKFTLKATLKINGKLVKGKTVKFTLNGKTYTVKTNAKGVAQKTLGKNVIKTLKKGKTYTVKVTYNKDTIKTTVKVK